MNPEQALQETGSAQRPLEPFRQTLAKQALKLERGKTTTLQINVGLLCNQSCRHCHLSAGPHRPENMSSETAQEVIAYAGRSRFDTIDITGGAPELNPNTEALVRKASSLAPRVMVRSNLSALEERNRDEWMRLLKDHRVVIVASFPSHNEAQTDSQRGRGVFQMSIDALRKLNAMGYGQEGTGLELDLVSNPTGAFLPTPQGQTEQRFREVLKQKVGNCFQPPLLLCQRAFGKIPPVASAVGKSRELFAEACLQLQSLCRRRGDVSDPCLCFLGRISLRLRFQSGSGPSPGRQANPRLPHGGTP